MIREAVAPVFCIQSVQSRGIIITLFQFGFCPEKSKFVICHRFERKPWKFPFHFRCLLHNTFIRTRINFMVQSYCLIRKNKTPFRWATAMPSKVHRPVRVVWKPLGTGVFHQATKFGPRCLYMARVMQYFGFYSRIQRTVTLSALPCVLHIYPFT